MLSRTVHIAILALMLTLAHIGPVSAAPESAGRRPSTPTSYQAKAHAGNSGHAVQNKRSGKGKSAKKKGKTIVMEPIVIIGQLPPTYVPELQQCIPVKEQVCYPQ